jgi:hypothetical protein
VVLLGGPLNDYQAVNRGTGMLSGRFSPLLSYDPYESPGAMKRLLGDLTSGVLLGTLHHRSASAVRNLILAWIDVDLHEKIPDLEKRIESLEAAQKENRRNEQ